MPEGAIYVGRPTKWGNPFNIGPDRPAREAVLAFAIWLDTMEPAAREAYLAPLRGRDLACWCKVYTGGRHHKVWCHADILLDRANRSAADE